MTNLVSINPDDPAASSSACAALLTAARAFVAAVEQVDEARFLTEARELRRRDFAELLQAANDVTGSTGGWLESLTDALGEFPAGWDQLLQDVMAQLESASEDLTELVNELHPEGG